MFAQYSSPSAPQDSFLWPSWLRPAQTCFEKVSNQTVNITVLVSTLSNQLIEFKADEALLQADKVSLLVISF